MGKIKKTFEYFLKTMLPLLLIACSLNLIDKHWNLASTYFRSGQYKRALSEYDKVLKLNPSFDKEINALRQKAIILHKHLRRYQEAIDVYFQLAKKSRLDQEIVSSLRQIAEIYAFNLGNYPEANKVFLEIVNKYDYEFRSADKFIQDWAAMLYESGQFRDAAKKIAEFRNYFPGHDDTPRSYLEEARAYLAAQEVEEAKKIFLKIVELFVGDSANADLLAEAYFGLGNVHEDRDELKKSLEYFEKSLEFYPNREVVELKIRGLKRRLEQRPE